MINCEIEPILTWCKNCVLISKATRDGNYTADPILPKIDTPTFTTFQITETKLYDPVAALSTENVKKLLEQLKSGFKRTVKWNKYRSQMTIQNNNNNLNYLIDPTFTKVNRLFVLSFARNAEGDRRDSFSDYYVSNVEIKDFNVLIDGKSFFEFPVKSEEEAYENIIEMSRNNDCTTGNLLNFAYFRENYRLIATDLSKETKLKDPQQINFIGKVEGQDHGATVFLIIKKSEETNFEFLQNSVNII